MQTTFEEWRGARPTASGRATRPPAPAQHGTAVVGSPVELPSDRVYSFAQMKRLEAVARPDGQRRPPSVVGSVKSFRSVITTEEQVAALDRQVSKMADRQKHMEAKLEQILELLKAGSSGPPQKADGPATASQTQDARGPSANRPPPSSGTNQRSS